MKSRDYFLMWSKLDSYNRKVQRSYSLVQTWLSRIATPYVAFSTGKDSTCVLHIVRHFSSNVPAVYFDADCSFPESKQLLKETDCAIVEMTDEPLMDTLSENSIYSDDVSDLLMKTTVYNPIRRIISKYNFDGVAYGLRKEESRARKKHADVHGSIFQYKRDSLWACQPICEWTYNDVWAFIFSNNLNYCKTYNKMFDMPEDDQRISYFAGETKRRRGRYAWLKRNYPGMFNKLASVLPEVRAYV